MDESNDLLSEQNSSQEWCATPCVKAPLRKLNDFIISVSTASSKVKPAVRQLSIPWTQAASSTQRYYKKKGVEVVNMVLECLAPGQGAVLEEELKKKDDKVKPAGVSNIESNELSRLITLYEEADSWFLKRQVLSVFVNDYTKARLRQLIPGLSIWSIDEARKHAAKTGAGKPFATSEPISRSRLDRTKMDHFIDFVSSPNFLQDVAYGTKKLKLSHGDIIEIPNVIRTVIASRLVQLHFHHCSESGFQPLGKSTLFSILQVISWLILFLLNVCEFI